MVTYSTKGTCSKQIIFELDDDNKIHNVKFIGGCSGRTDDAVIFTGKLESHPDGAQMRSFIRSRNLQIVELADGPLIDIGGMIVFSF